jgi:chaperonin GroES
VAQSKKKKPAGKAAKSAKATKSAKAAKAAKSVKSIKNAKSAKSTIGTKGAKGSKPSVSSSKAAAKTVNWQDILTPLDDRLVIEIEQLEKTAGGLFIPATASERPQRGKVLAVGRGKRDKKGRVRPMDVRLGDEVLFANFAGTPITISGHDVVIMRESDLLGVID